MRESRRTKGLAVLSEFRGELCGLAIISIMIFHFTGSYASYANQNEIDLGLAWNLYNNIIASIGVEIFLFFSGFGLYYSMARNHNVIKFYWKRLTRILIPYLLFAPAAFYAIDIYYQQLSTEQYIMDLTTASFWTEGNLTFWYVSFILALYILFPLFFYIIDKRGLAGIGFLMVIILPVLLLMEKGRADVYNNVSIAITRIPIFLVGVLWGKYAYEKRRWRWSQILVVVTGIAVKVFFVVGSLMNYAEREDVLGTVMYMMKKYTRYTVQWFTLSLIVVLAVLFSFILPKFVAVILRWFGKISLELYITHIAIRLVFKYEGFPLHEWWCYLGCMAIAIVLSVVINTISNFLVALLNGEGFRKRKAKLQEAETMQEAMIDFEEDIEEWNQKEERIAEERLNEKQLKKEYDNKGRFDEANFDDEEDFDEEFKKEFAVAFMER